MSASAGSLALNRGLEGSPRQEGNKPNIGPGGVGAHQEFHMAVSCKWLARHDNDNCLQSPCIMLKWCLVSRVKPVTRTCALASLKGEGSFNHKFSIIKKSGFARDRNRARVFLLLRLRFRVRGATLPCFKSCLSAMTVKAAKARSLYPSCKGTIGMSSALSPAGAGSAQAAGGCGGPAGGACLGCGAAGLHSP